MPRNVGTDIYFIPPGTEGFPDTTIESEKYNTYIHDVETDLNRPRPIAAGGTGATTADGALTNLSAEKANQVVSNFNTHPWMSGSFNSNAAATGSPIDGHAFAGIVYKAGNGDFAVEARDTTTGFVYTRVQVGGVWSVWGRTDAPLTCADDPPTGFAALDNSLWFESSTGLLYVRYNDGDSSQWCIACPQPDISTYAIKTDVAADVTGLQAGIDALEAGKVAKIGDTMDGPLVLSASPPIADLQAANKKYVDDIVSASGTNSIINGDFRINQAGYVSAAALSAGTYGHDQWKAGASGGNYSFTQLKTSTQITIASGKSLIQPIEDIHVIGGYYVLSWAGTAQARAGVNTLTPSGAYADSPLLITGQTAGTVMSVEFNNGTLGSVKLEIGNTATPFVMRPYERELSLCQRYFWQVPDKSSFSGFVGAPTVAFGTLKLEVAMRAPPSATFPSAVGAYQVGLLMTTVASNFMPALLPNYTSTNTAGIQFNTAASLTAGHGVVMFLAGGIINLNARL